MTDDTGAKAEAQAENDEKPPMAQAAMALAASAYELLGSLRNSHALEALAAVLAHQIYQRSEGNPHTSYAMLARVQLGVANNLAGSYAANLPYPELVPVDSEEAPVEAVPPGVSVN